MSHGPVEFKYGNYEFRPAPIFNISTDAYKTSEGSGWGINHRIVLDGNLILTGNEVQLGVTGLFKEIDNLRSAVSQDGYLLVATCNDGVGTNPIISGRPIVNSFSVESTPDNYTRSAKYTVEFGMPTLMQGTGQDTINPSGFDGGDPHPRVPIHPPFIESFSENWQSDFKEKRIGASFSGDYRTSTGTVVYTEDFLWDGIFTHTIDVKGRTTYTGTSSPTSLESKPGWQSAYDYATGYLNDKYGVSSDASITTVSASGLIGLPITKAGQSLTIYDRFRNASINRTDNSVSVTETFSLQPQAAGSDNLDGAFETFDISLSTEGGVTSATVQGQIQGYSLIDYKAGTNYNGDSVTENQLREQEQSIEKARAYFSDLQTKDVFFKRAAHATLNSESFLQGSCQRAIILADRPKTITVGENPLQGTISYSISYDDSLQGCITGDCILSQNITVDDQLESDVFATQTILGRAQGPLLQDIGTTTARVKTISVEVVTVPPTSCASVEEINKTNPSGQVNDFITTIYNSLTGNYSQVFTSSNGQSWNFTQGRYTKNIAFTYNNCSGT